MVEFQNIRQSGHLIKNFKQSDKLGFIIYRGNLIKYISEKSVSKSSKIQILCEHNENDQFQLIYLISVKISVLQNVT